jgi:ATP-dependent DNA helicase RecG
MLVEHPERFGLSQLHQLRGRVGRGAEASYCILLGDVSPETKQRLDVFVGSDDGFVIAREDLRLRGHGRPVRRAPERRGDLPRRRPAARRAAERDARATRRTGCSRTIPSSESPANAPIRRVLGERYARSLELFRVG